MSFELALVKMANAKGQRAAKDMLESAVREGRFDPEDFSLQGLAKASMGEEWYRHLHNSMSGRQRGVQLIEADGASQALNSTAFPNLTGQLMFDAMLPEYEAPDLIAGQLARTIRTRLKSQVIPGVSGLGNQIREVGEGESFQAMGFSENTLTTAETKKRGGFLAITKEMIFHDQTGLALMKARDVGESMALDKEERVLDMVAGDTGIAGLYNRNGTTYNTYLTTGAYVNAGSTPLQDRTDIDTARNLFVDITHPDTGKRLRWRPTAILTVPHIHQTALEITGARVNGYESDPSSAGNVRRSGAPLSRYSSLSVLSSEILYDRVVTKVQSTEAKAKAFWWIGDFQKAFAYVENWDMTISQAAMNSDASFYNDVVMAFKVSEKGTTQVMEPRHVIRMGDTT